jgi:hypothetical protein
MDLASDDTTILPSLNCSHWRLLSSVIAKLSSFFVESRNEKECLILSITVKFPSPIPPYAFVRTPPCLPPAYHSHCSLFFNAVLHSFISYHKKTTVKAVGFCLTASHHDMGVEMLEIFQDSDPVNNHRTNCPHYSPWIWVLELYRLVRLASDNCKST